MTKYYIYSTLTSDTKYTNWKQGGGDMPMRDGAVLIKGGTNVIDSHFITPRGVVTSITEDELKILELNPVFLRHKENGFIRVEKVHAAKIEEVVSDMVGRDESAPLVPEDYDAESAAAPKVNSSTKSKK